MIVLIAAVPFETARLRMKLQGEAILDHPFAIVQGRLGPHPTWLVHAGVGKANAAAATAHLLTQNSPDLVISFGCGGSYPGGDLAVGDLAVATEALYGDEGVMGPEGFLDMKTLDLALLQNEDGPVFGRFPVDSSIVETLRSILASAMAPRRVGFGPVVTVSTCSGTLTAGQALARRTGGIAENMEGAAVAQVCALFGVPFLEFRGISNLVEDRDRSRWDLAAGSETAQKAVLAALEVLPFL